MSAENALRILIENKLNLLRTIKTAAEQLEEYKKVNFSSPIKRDSYKKPNFPTL